MKAKLLFVVVPAAFFILGDGAAVAGQTIDKVGVIACVTDKWTETELEKGHKLADSVQRCVLIPNDPAAEKGTQACVGKYEYMPDGSWKGSGTCTDTYKSSGTIFEAWEEGSGLKEYTFKFTGGTGKYDGASGGGTYFYESLTDTLAGGTYNGKLVLP